MTNVLVLGSAGYLGSSLTPTLVKLGYDVIAADSLIYNQGVSQINLLPYQFYDHSSAGTYNFLKIDCNNWDDISRLVKSADIIFPLFALVGAPLCDAKPKLAQQTNLKSIKKIVDNLGTYQRLIYPTTNSIFGSNDEICTEESPTNCFTIYSQTKYGAEQYILKNHKNSVVFRLATIFGMSMRLRLDLMVNDFIYKAYFDKHLMIFDPNYRRNFLHVADAVQAFVYAINNLGQGELYNLGNDRENKTKLELAQQIQTAIGCELTIGEGKDPDCRNYEISSAKLTKAGFTAHTSINTAISEFKEYFNYLPKNKRIREQMLKYNRNI